MNLINCTKCGVVLNKNDLNFPEDIWDDGSIDDSKGKWDGRDFVPFVECPVCKGHILESE